MNKRSAEDSKLKILEAARIVFAEYGYAGASMRTIASQAGISVGGVYLYFKNKEQLYLTFMQKWMSSLNDRTQDALLATDDPVEAITAFVIIAIEFARTHKEIITLQGTEFGFSFGSDFKQKFSRERRNRIAEIIRAGITRGIFLECDPDDMAKVIFNMLRGFVVSMVIDEESLFTPEDCINLVLHGLLRRNCG